MKMKFNILASVLSLVAMSMGATYYVNPSEDPVTGGNDAWDGTAEVWEGGESLHGPKRTLVGVMEVATSSGDVVIALPGTYASGLVDLTKDQYVRVSVPAGVTLKSKYGAKATIIMGKAADNPVEGYYGCGTGSPARCVQLNANSRLEGFTLTGGRTVCGSVTNSHGAVTAPVTATIAYCIISNNVSAYRSGAVQDGKYFGCIFLDNRAMSLGNVHVGSQKGTCFCNCFFDYTPAIAEPTGVELYSGSNSRTVTVVNCTFSPRVNQVYGKTAGGINLYNCIDLSVNGAAHAICSNSVYLTKGSGTIYNHCAVTTVAKMALNEDGSLQATSEAINLGDTSLYEDKVAAAFGNLKDFDISGFSRVAGGKIDLGCYEYDPDGRDWYVDPAGSDLNSGRSADKAFRTLAAATKAEWLHSGDVIHAAPGTYDEGMDDESKIIRCRVRVPAGVTLKATGGAEQTFILGADSTHELAHASGNGTNAMRCVAMDSKARVEGFTLTGGRTAPGARGGGAAGSGYLVDCVVSNNSAFERGGAVEASVTSIRCRFLRNSADELATIVQGGAIFFDCYFADNVNEGGGNYSVYGSSSGSPAKLYNCTFAGGDQYSVRGATINYNCLFLGSISGGSNGKTSYFYSCALPKTPSDSILDENCIVKKASNFPIDSEGRPLISNLCIDAGSNLCYTAAYPLGDPVPVDLLGTNRIYNGRIDIGCCEYDWRGIYAQDLAKKQVSVTAASAGVKETVEKLVSLSDGDSLTAEFTTTLSGTKVYVVQASVTGAGTLTISFPDGGTATVVAADGDKVVSFASGGAPCSVTLAFAGEGTAVLHDFLPPSKGTFVSIR